MNVHDQETQPVKVEKKAHTERHTGLPAYLDR
jgi:hypothetical protein